MKTLLVGDAWEEGLTFVRRERRLVGPLALAFFFLPALFIRWAYPAGAGAGAMWLSLIQMVAVFAGFLAIVALALGVAGSVGEALRLARQRLGRVLLAFLLTGIPLTIILIALILALGSTSLESGMSPERMAAEPSFRRIMLIAMLLVGIVAARLLPLWGEAVSAPHSGWSLLKRSWALSTGHWLKLFAVVVGLLLLGVVAQQAAVWSVGSVAILALGQLAPFSLSALVMALAGATVGAIFAVINAVLAARLYAQLAGRD